jgi:hypothetical protein
MLDPVPDDLQIFVVQFDPCIVVFALVVEVVISIASFERAMAVQHRANPILREYYVKIPEAFRDLRRHSYVRIGVEVHGDLKGDRSIRAWKVVDIHALGLLTGRDNLELLIRNSSIECHIESSRYTVASAVALSSRRGNSFMVSTSYWG